jgi:hypothetical protein
MQSKLNADNLILPGDALYGNPHTNKLAPCEQRLLEYVSILRAIEQGNPNEFWPSLGKICNEDLWAFERFLLRYRWMDPWFHGEVVIQFIHDTVGKSRMALLPRGSGKTGCITIPMPAWALAKNPNNTVVINNAREDRAQSMGRASAAIIDSNKMYQMAYPHIRPSDKWAPTGGFRLIVNNPVEGSTERVDPSISCFGVGCNLTGTHANAVLINDDLLNRRMADSPTELQKAEDHFIESLNCIDSGTPMFVCGTRWRYTDFYGKIESGEIGSNDGPFEILKLGVYKDDGELIWPQKTFVDLGGRKQQAGYTDEMIKAAQKREKHFSALYMNNPVLDTDVQFDISMLQTFKTIQDLPFKLGPLLAVGVECESQGHALFSTIQLLKRQQHRSFRIEKLTSKRISKEERIKTALQTRMKEGKIHIREDLWLARNNVGEELRTFPKGYDDCLDGVTHAVTGCKEPPKGSYPMVYIAVDPAFTKNAQSDYTAIVAATVYNDNYYILDCHRFQTSKSDHLVSLLFQMVDKFSDGEPLNIGPKQTFSAFQSYAYNKSKPRFRRGVMRDDHFAIESPFIKGETKI